MHERIRSAAITVSLFIILFLILGAARNASALSVIYGGRNTVDLQIGQLSGTDWKYILKRDGSEIRTWDGRAGAPSNQMLYHADQGCDLSGGAQACSYTLELYQWYAEGEQPAGWHLGATQEVTALAGSEHGTLHNGLEWLTRLDRNAVSWDKGGTYHIDGNLQSFILMEGHYEHTMPRGGPVMGQGALFGKPQDDING